MAKDRKEYIHQWYLSNKEKKAEYERNRYSNNKEKFAENQTQYRNTPMGRAVRLCNNYKHADINANRGDCTLTAKWIVDNIFSQPCAHCGKTDWHKIGCNRIDNKLPHTPDNVEPCCLECNKKLYYTRNKK